MENNRVQFKDYKWGTSKKEIENYFFRGNITYEPLEDSELEYEETILEEKFMVILRFTSKSNQLFMVSLLSPDNPPYSLLLKIHKILTTKYGEPNKSNLAIVNSNVSLFWDLGDFKMYFDINFNVHSRGYSFGIDYASKHYSDVQWFENLSEKDSKIAQDL